MIDLATSALVRNQESGLGENLSDHSLKSSRIRFRHKHHDKAEMSIITLPVILSS